MSITHSSVCLASTQGFRGMVMTLLLSPAPEKFLLGYLVLNASKALELPFISKDTEVRQHIEGAVNGSVVSISSETYDFYYPQRGRNYTLNSIQNYSSEESRQGVMTAFANIHDKSDVDASFHSNLESSFFDTLQENSLLVIEQHKPFGLNAIFSRGVDLYMFGLHTEEQSLLVWTNLANFEDLLNRNYGDKFWLYRFRPRRDTTTVIFSRRVCSRWFRWSQQANFRSPAARYPALEKSLFSKSIEPL